MAEPAKTRNRIVLPDGGIGVASMPRLLLRLSAPAVLLWLAGRYAAAIVG